MTKLRLPKPAAGNVVSRHLYLGSVYTTEQMRKFAEKSVLAERERVLKILDDQGTWAHIGDLIELVKQGKA
jgi:hypothetical protein